MTQGILTFKDNAKLIIYGSSETEVTQTFNSWIKAGCFDSKFLDSRPDIKTGTIARKLQQLEVVPRRAKFYKTGQKNLVPDWIEVL